MLKFNAAAKLRHYLVYGLGRIATIGLWLCHSLVLYIFIEQQNQHPAAFGVRLVCYTHNEACGALSSSCSSIILWTFV